MEKNPTVLLMSHYTDAQPEAKQPLLERRMPLANLPRRATATIDKVSSNEQSIIDSEWISIAQEVIAEDKGVQIITNVLARTPQSSCETIKGKLAPIDVMTKEIVFIDAKVIGLAGYLQAYFDANVMLIDTQQDGLIQIANVLVGCKGINSMHIISHGESGKLYLGNATVNVTALKQQYADALSIIKAALNRHAYLLIDGCDVTRGKRGKKFIDYLAFAIDANVVTSVDVIAHAD